MSEFTKQDYATKWIPVSQLSVAWAKAQRTFNEKHAKKIADNFDPDMFGVLSVSKPNKDGIYHIIDGQHRKAAIQALFGDRETVPCNIFDVSDQARAAKMFDRINNSRKATSPLDRFRVRITAGSEVEVTINNIVNSLGYRIEMVNGREGVIGSVQALTAVYQQFGPEVLKKALKTIQDTWGMDYNSVSAPLLRGYGAFIAEYGSGIDHKRLVSSVAQKYAPGSLLGSAKGAKQIMGITSMVEAVKYILLRTYNAGLKKDKLTPKG